MSDEIKDSQKPLTVLPPQSSELTPIQPPHSSEQTPVQPLHSPESVPMQPPYSPESAPIQPHSSEQTPVQPLHSPESVPMQPPYSPESAPIQPHSSEQTPVQPLHSPESVPMQPPYSPESVPIQPYSPGPTPVQPQQKQALSPAASKGKLWENPLFVGIITSISSILLTLLVTNILPGVYQTPMQIAELSKDIESLQQEIKRESDKRSNDIRYLLQSTSEDIQELWIQINGISQRLGMPVDLSPTDEMKTAITNDYVISSLNVSGSTELRATDTIAYSVITGQEYTVDQLASQKLLLPYISGSQEVYFYGQLSDGGRWDGHCIINVYENNKLVFVRDAQYDDGYLVRSKAVFSYTIKKGQDVWAISDRINNDSYSSGETTLYAWKSDFKQNFAFDTVSPANILSADNIRSILEAESYLYAYYYGDISDGWFNDETGSAYMIYFFEDGTVKQLYMGNFKNGTYEDNTGNAWFILREEDTDYMFFKGFFSGGKHLRDGNHKFESLGPPLSLDEINELIAGKHFNIELDWSADAFH